MESKISRIKTGIEYFDNALNGGIPAGSTVLISGTTGTMKSIFAYYILHNNKGKGLYITLEQSKQSLEEQMKNFGFSKENVRVIDRSEIGKATQKIPGKSFLDVFLQYIKMEKNALNFSLLVIDSLPALEIVSDMQKPRIELFRFFESLRDLNITAFLITEMSPDLKSYGRYEEDYLADGVIHLKMEEISEVKTQRRIRCVKMRTTMHSADWYTLFISAGKLQVTEVISE